jgi:hypothetical protein
MSGDSQFDYTPENRSPAGLVFSRSLRKNANPLLLKLAAASEGLFVLLGYTIFSCLFFYIKSSSDFLVLILVFDRAEITTTARSLLVAFQAFNRFLHGDPPLVPLQLRFCIVFRMAENDSPCQFIKKTPRPVAGSGSA